MGLFFPANTSKQKFSVWVVCTLPERVFPNRLCPIAAPFLTGSCCPMTKLESKFSSPPRDWQQDPEDPQEQGSCPRLARGHLLLDQEGRVHPQALGEEPQGQGFKIPSYFGGKSYPTSGSLLQDQGSTCPRLEIRFQHCFCACLIRCLPG